MARIIRKSTIGIGSLPDTCPQKRVLLSYVKSPFATVNVVLSLESGQYIAYIGYPHPSSLREEIKSADVLYNCKKIQTHDQVARLGDRLDDSTKAFLFPDSTPWAGA